MKDLYVWLDLLWFVCCFVWKKRYTATLFNPTKKCPLQRDVRHPTNLWHKTHQKARKSSHATPAFLLHVCKLLQLTSVYVTTGANLRTPLRAADSYRNQSDNSSYTPNKLHFSSMYTYDQRVILQRCPSYTGGKLITFPISTNFLNAAPWHALPES